MTTDQPSVEDARAEASPLDSRRIQFARELAEPDWSLSVPEPAKAVIRDLLAEVERLAASRAVPSDQGEKRLPGHCPPHGERLEYTTGDRGSSEPGCTCVRRYVPAVPAVPSDHTATTEDADLRERIVDALVMSPMSDTVGTDMAPVHRTADTILGLLATARSAATTEDARAEAERRWGNRRTSDRLPMDWLDEGMASGFVLGAQWAAGHAETTTATTEDAARVIRELIYLTPEKPFRTLPQDAAQALAAAGLLATARPDTTTEWGTADSYGQVYIATDEAAARYSIKDSPRWTVVRREVTAWIEADQ